MSDTLPSTSPNTVSNAQLLHVFMLIHQSAFSITAIEGAFERIVKMSPKQHTPEAEKKFQKDIDFCKLMIETLHRSIASMAYLQRPGT
jgi:phage FluMu gp28-like protein